MRSTKHGGTWPGRLGGNGIGERSDVLASASYHYSIPWKPGGFQTFPIKAPCAKSAGKYVILYKKSPKEIANEDIKRYLANKEVSNATLSLAINVLKFYYT